MAAMVMAVAMDMVDTEAIMARGRLMLPPMLLLMLSPAMDTTDVATDMAAMEVTDGSMVETEATTARGRLRLLPMLSPAMDTTAVDMAAMEDMATDVPTDTEATTERGRLRLLLSPAMDTTAVDMAMAATATDVSMVDTADTTDKFLSNGTIPPSFTATFILVLKLSLVLPQNFLK